MKRVPPSARLKEEIEGLLRGDTTAAPPCDDAPMAGFVRQLARYILQVSIEAEATAKFLKAGHRIHEVPIRYRARSREEGKKLRWTDGLEAVWIILRVRLLGR